MCCSARHNGRRTEAAQRQESVALEIAPQALGKAVGQKKNSKIFAMIFFSFSAIFGHFRAFSDIFGYFRPFLL
jgi:hypothetical protein